MQQKNCLPAVSIDFCNADSECHAAHRALLLERWRRDHKILTNEVAQLERARAKCTLQFIERYIK